MTHSLFDRLSRPLTVEGGILLLRLWLGAMMIFHGWGKVFNPSAKFITGIGDMGFPMPEVFATAAAWSEFGGGVLLVLGLFARPAAIFGAITMGVAAFMKHGNDVFGDGEQALTYLILHVIILLIGPGRFSLDCIIAWRTRPERSGS